MSESKQLRVLQMTDTHLFADTQRCLYGQNTDHSFRSVLTHLQARNPACDLVILTGDLAEEGEQKAYERLVQRFADWSVPILALPGNHDASATMAQAFEASNIQFLGHRVLKNWRFIMLDSTNSAYRDAGFLDDAVFAELDRTLKDNQKNPVMICLHHPPMSVETAWCDEIGLINGRKLLSLLRQYTHVKAVVSGHVHQAYQTTHGHMMLFTSPSTCAQFQPRAAEFAIDPSPPGYRWFNLDPQGDLESGIERVALSV